MIPELVFTDLNFGTTVCMAAAYTSDERRVDSLRLASISDDHYLEYAN
jgi:hypothetical protein